MRGERSWFCDIVLISFVEAACLQLAAAFSSSLPSSPSKFEERKGVFALF